MTAPSLAARALLVLVRAYQLLLSPFLGGHCRFEPSCSRYAASCIESHGAWRGGLLSMRRLCKCHPFHAGGHDPPPTLRSPATPATFPPATTSSATAGMAPFPQSARAARAHSPPGPRAVARGREA